MTMAWYSASMSYLVTVKGCVSSKTLSVVVLQAPEGEWDTAKAKAISLGRLQEQTYLNDDGETVEWRLTAVETLDYLGTEVSDGREVYSEPRDIDDRDSRSERVLRPEASEPGSCGV
jgi:hypothetical protein